MAQFRNDEKEVSQIRKCKKVMAQVRNDEEEVSQIRKGKEVMTQDRNDEDEVSQIRKCKEGAGQEWRGRVIKCQRPYFRSAWSWRLGTE
jgi:hypothetical protein